MLFSGVARLDGMGPAEAAAATRDAVDVRGNGPRAAGPLSGIPRLSVVASGAVNTQERAGWSD